MALRHIDRLDRLSELQQANFQTLAQMAAETNADSCEAKLGWDRETDEYDDGDYIPELILRVRRPSG